jgi:hypothetical protein
MRKAMEKQFIAADFAGPEAVLFQPDANMSNDDLEDQISELAAHISAATYQLLVLIEAFDRRGGWSDWGIASCAHWLNWKCGIALGAAREKVRVARCLPELPLISAAFARGEISYSKVRAMSRIATPGNEDYLLEIARHGTASHVEKLVRGYRRYTAAQENAHANQAHASRALHYYHDETGCLVFRGRLPAELGAVLVKALEAAGDFFDQERADVSAETSADPYMAENRFAARRADALGLLAESFLARGAATASGGERYQVVVHVDGETLKQEGQGDRCELESGPCLGAETARRLSCEASLVRITEDAKGTPLDIGRKTRSIPPALRRALSSRDQGCRFPGCTHRRFVDGHHIHHWAAGGATDLANLVLLCRGHHRLVHEGGFTLRRLDDGALVFARPDGRPVTNDAPSRHVDWRDLPARNRARGLAIDQDTAVTLWDGYPMDYSMAMQALEIRAQGGPACAA